MQGNFTAILEREDDQYVALCPELDVASQGPSLETALANLREAIQLLLETASPDELQARYHGPVFVTQVQVQAHAS